MNREEGAYMDQLIKEKSRLRQTVRKYKGIIEDVSKQINLLYFEHDRMSSSGKECLDKLVKSLGMGESK
jgi:hypothetical protein